MRPNKSRIIATCNAQYLIPWVLSVVLRRRMRMTSDAMKAVALQ
jgi:hypothetical protein